MAPKPGRAGELGVSIASDHRLVTELASTDEAGGLAKERSVLLLWFFRNVLGLDDLDAYEFVCDGDNDAGIDGLYLEPSTGDEDHETLVIYQSKYTQSPGQVGPNAFARLLASAAHFKDADSLETLLAGNVENKLRALVVKFDLVRKLRDGAYAEGRLRVRAVLVATGTLTQEATELMEATNRDEGPGYLQVYDLHRLGPLARAVAAPTAQTERISADCSDDAVVIVGDAPNRVAVAALKATDIVEWDGLDSRALFALNVRSELRKNKVRDQLDGAIRRHDEHPDFLRFHNGMTVVCESFNVENGALKAEQPSIVNGAQSAIAFARALEEGELTDELRVFVKFVEVAGRPQLSKEVSWRSNTQTAVNARNLMALGGPQERIKQEVEQDHSDFIYEIVPDASFEVPEGKRLIPNDETAQLLCGVFNAMPWLAVKRLALFESENHALIFNEQITGSHVVLVAVIRQCVDDEKDKFPEEYRKSWRLTRLVAVYLVSQILRADEDLASILAGPEAALVDEQKLREKLTLPVRIAATVLKQRHDQRDRDQLPDNFSVDFKNQDELQRLRDEARNLSIMYKTVGSLE